MGSTLAQIDSAEEERALTRYMEDRGMPKKKQVCTSFQSCISEENHSKRRKKIKAVMSPQELEEELKYYHETICRLGAFGLVQPSTFNILPVLKVPKGKQDRALLTAPPGISIRNSSIPNAGFGAWTEMFIPKKTILGSYEGKLVPISEVRDASYGWIKNIGKNVYMVDGINPTQSNWLRYVNSPRTDAEENVLPVVCKENVYYVVPRDIAPKTELMITYGSNYDELLGTVRNHPDLEIPQRSWQIRVNSVHIGQNSSLTHGDGSPVLYTNFRLHLKPSKPKPIKLLLSFYEGKWSWAKEENYSFYSDLRNNYLHYPFICEKSGNSV
ncbi:histone-lysine N-methyltransferase PRDM16-like [Saccostrea cucullata]|uniref:histone-lysine N-methyltransferase PRDM16-like n=1 Tax=Saccostrea cuccullata TaxID=36930 RepID=UPI002ED6A6A6